MGIAGHAHGKKTVRQDTLEDSPAKRKRPCYGSAQTLVQDAYKEWFSSILCQGEQDLGHTGSG